MANISVLLTTEGTYPFHQGGVSTWCDILVKRMKSVEFTVFSVLMDPYVTQKFDLGTGTKLIKVPLWGTEEPSEHLDRLFSATYLAKQRTTKQIVEKEFLPLFRQLVDEVVSGKKNAFRFAHALLDMHEFFSEYDYKAAFKSPVVWEAYKDIIRRPEYLLPEPDIYSLIQSLGWVYRFFNIINTPVPKTSVTHSSAAAFCGLPCVIAKLKYGTPFLLTEHGVYLREQYLSLAKRGYPSFLNSFLMRLIHSIVNVCYEYADQISPVCAYNIRWEQEFTGRLDRIQVIYNGVDHKIFMKAKQETHDVPTVVTVARIDPVKDIVTLMHAAAAVREQIPDVQFLIFGSVSVPEYYDQCLRLREQLGLQQTIHFMGHTVNIVEAYERADVVVQTSISEAFPYAVVEAMLAGKAVVSTDVGGIPEALADTGILVPPRTPEAVASGIVRLLTDSAYRQELAQAARERALNLFTLDRCLEQYLKTYIKLCILKSRWTEEGADSRRAAKQTSGKPLPVRRAAGERRRRQRLYAERAFALRDVREDSLATRYLEMAVQADPASPAAPALMAEVERLSLRRKDFDATLAARGKSHELESHLRRRFQHLMAERAYALAAYGYFDLAIEHVRRAIRAYPESAAFPVLSLDMSKWYQARGQENKAAREKWRAELVMRLQAAQGVGR